MMLPLGGMMLPLGGMMLPLGGMMLPVVRVIRSSPGGAAGECRRAAAA